MILELLISKDMKKALIFSAIILASLVASCAPKGLLESSDKPLSVRMVESEMKRIPDPIYMDGVEKPKWNYTTGLELLAIMDAGAKYGRRDFTDYALSWLERMVSRRGDTIVTYKMSNYNLDHICPGRLLYRAWDLTGDPRYYEAQHLLWSQLESQPRTREGGYWHKKVYPDQMWLDGLYMAEPYKAEYLLRHKKREGVEAPKSWMDLIHQFTLVAEKTYDPATGLFRHAWDSSKKMFWCDPENGQSEHAWLRAMGWYTVALVEVLDLMPDDIGETRHLVTILDHIFKTIPRYAHPESGMWYQVMDCPGREGNYEESTGSIMLIYAMMKASRLGLVDGEYGTTGRRLYEQFVERFMRENEDGTISMTDCCAVGGLGGKQMRRGDYAYYLSEPIIENDCKGVGPFIWASLEYEGKY